MILFSAGFAMCFALWIVAGIWSLRRARPAIRDGPDDDVHTAECIVTKLGSETSSRTH